MPPPHIVTFTEAAAVQLPVTWEPVGIGGKSAYHSDGEGEIQRVERLIEYDWGTGLVARPMSTNGNATAAIMQAHCNVSRLLRRGSSGPVGCELRGGAGDPDTAIGPTEPVFSVVAFVHLS